MKMNKKYCIIFVIATLLSMGYAHGQKKGLNVIYGDYHIFTIETPTNWINDKEAAQKIDLTNFFYCANDKEKAQKSHMYANGIDKVSDIKNLKSFVDGDIIEFKKKYPDAEYSIIEGEHTPPIINNIILSFSNLHDRYREEVVYIETKEAIIVLCFSAFSEEDYLKYVDVFDSEFVGSFMYRGNNPKSFLEWQKNNQ